jgi:hypothetical protein
MAFLFYAEWCLLAIIAVMMLLHLGLNAYIAGRWTNWSTLAGFLLLAAGVFLPIVYPASRIISQNEPDHGTGQVATLNEYWTVTQIACVVGSLLIIAGFGSETVQRTIRVFRQTGRPSV